MSLGSDWVLIKVESKWVFIMQRDAISEGLLGSIQMLILVGECSKTLRHAVVMSGALPQ